MKKIYTIVMICCIVSILSAFKKKEHLFLSPNYFPKPTYLFNNNPLDNNKIVLGRVLFYDPILSKNNTISCASCHSQYNAFAHTDHALSHGINDKIGNRNAPVLFNLAWQKFFMVDGAINHLDMQALAPISNPSEMNEDIKHVAFKLQQTNLYPKLFYNAFGDSIISGEHLLKAIAQFMLTLVSANSKYDKVVRKETTFSKQEENGYQLFKQHCNICHTEPLFTNMQFENNGLKMDTLLNDFGRYRITKDKNDSLKFKVPTLRNIEFSYPYMHDGRFKKLNDVINHYTNAVQQSNTLSVHLQKRIVLSDNEKIDLIAFLLTLSDKDFLFNPSFSFPKDILLKE